MNNMQLKEELAQAAPEQETLITLGVFDGVHLGHQYLISQLKEEAQRRGLDCGVVTFRNHPQMILSPQTIPAYLTNLSERVRLLQNLGVDLVVPISFTVEVAHLEPGQFVELLQQHLKMRGLVIGPDFALGRGRKGNSAVLHELGIKMGFTVDVVTPVMLDNEVVSSTIIRNTLTNGDMPKASKLLGRYFSFSGRITTGTQRGQMLGFPTANLELDKGQALPADGVYATIAHINNCVYHAVTNIGRRPTFGEGERTVEIHLINFDNVLYGEALNVEFKERIRDEQHFSTPEHLRLQIIKDIEQARAILGERAEVL
jgi:riboflavin kinase/FMN adenylyltransferase